MSLPSVGSVVSDAAGDPTELVRGYYTAIDGGDYERLRGLLAPGFVQRRSDRTFEGAAAFVAFMKSGRPRTDTTHRLDGLFVRPATESSRIEETDPGDRIEEADPDDGVGGDRTAVAAQGALYGNDGDRLFRFVDIFGVRDGALVDLETFTR